jgi:hypothetical protein
MSSRLGESTVLPISHLVLLIQLLRLFRPENRELAVEVVTLDTRGSAPTQGAVLRQVAAGTAGKGPALLAGLSRFLDGMRSRFATIRTSAA